MKNLLTFASVAKKTTQLLSTVARLRLLLVMLLTLTVSANAWGAEEVVYTLTPASGSNNSYAGNCDVTIDDITWNLTGNSTTTYWRIGGKSITNVDRALYSKTAIQEDISKIVISHGDASSITVNSVELIVSTDADGTGTTITSLEGSFSANSTMTFTRPAGTSWADAYYKFVYNVTVSGSSNKFVEFKEAEFYAETAPAVQYSITFNAGSGTCDTESLTETSAGAGVTLPTATIDCGDVAWTFAGWAEASVATETAEAPSTLYEAGDTYKPTSDITLYAVYQRTETIQGGGSGNYELVTSAPSDWSGTYLIVDGSSKNCFNGSLTTLDAGGNYATITISDNTITSTTTTDSYAVTISKSTTNGKYYIKTASGYYIGSDAADSSKSNELDASTSTKYDNSISISSNNVTIQGPDHILKFFYQTGQTWRFRFYKSTTTQNVRLPQLYKKSSGSSSTTYYHSTPECSTETLVSLNPNGGTISDTNWKLENGVYKLTTEDESITLPTITRTGYTFGGWATSSGGTKEHNANATITLDGTPVTLYAIWTANKYNITYKDQGNDVAFSGTHEDGYPTQHTYGIETTLKGATKIGYTFEGWHTDAACTNKVTTLGATEYTDAITLYAKWEEIPTTCTVTYYANGGTGTVTDNTQYTNGATVTIKGNYGALTKDGCAFTGWNTKADGTGKSYKHGDQFEITTNTTLYAQWCEAYWKLVTDNSEIEDDTRIVIAAKDYNYALSTEQKTNNRSQTEITKKYNTIVLSNDVQVLSLVGLGEKSFVLYTGSGYLYAAGSDNNNYLKTRTSIDGNCYWSIAISQTVAGIYAQGESQNNQIKYNNTNSLFSCYGEDNNQKDVVIYKEVCVQDQYNVTSTLTNTTATTTNPTTVDADATSLTLNYSANTGYLLPETITVKMGGVELLSGTDYNWNKETGVLAITVTGFYGDIDVKIVAEEDPCYQFEMSEVTATSTTPNSVTLTWTEVTGATGYNVKLGTGEFTAATGLTHTFEELTPKTTYNWEVQAVKDGLCEASKSGSTTTQKESFTITWNVAGETTTTTVVDGEVVSLPSDPISCSDTYTTFVGWYTEPSGMETSPTTTPQGQQVTASTVPTGNITYYAVWADAGEAAEVEDVLNYELIDVSGTSYTEWSDKTVTSSAVYAGQSAGGNDAIQLRSKNNNSGIITTTSGGKATKIAVAWNSNTANERTLDFYGKNSAYSAASDLYSTSTQGTNLGSIVKGTSTELTIDGDYEYIGLRSNDGAMYLDEIQITWSAGSEPTGYISSCCQSPAIVTVTPADANLELNIDGTASTTVNISQTGGGNGKYYEPTVSPADGASLDWAALGVTFKTTAYDIDFTATKAGTYTITGNFTETSYGCQKTGSATINVVANPILVVSSPTITSQCGTEGTPVAVTIDSRYLTGSSLTANVATTTSNGTFKICATENGTFGTSNLTNLTAGKDNKASITIYVRYDAIEDENTEATGTLTITDGTTSQEVELSTTPICGTSIRMTPTDANSVRVTTANGQWTRTQTAIHLRGAYLLQNLTGEQGAKVELTSSNPNFKFVKPDLQSSGTVKYESEKITDNTWEADVYLVYTPTSHNANETTTITAKVITFGGTTEHATATLTAYGRSFPETFVLALYTGSEWVALPADMIAPYGDCTTGVGTHDPYPITVNDNANPTTATLAPARAVYKGAARNTPTTNPWTIQFESNTQAGYYLFGSVYNDAANTSIANLAQATGEGLKWELNTEDNITYRLSQMNAPTFQLGYNATANYMGQYQSTATNFKYDFRILPVTSTCTYYIEPVMTLVDYTDNEAKVRIQYDGTNLYQISMNNKANWTNITGEIDCKDLTFTLPNTTYRGQNIWLKPQGDLCEPVESSASCHIPAPVINNPGDQNFVGTVNQPFSGTFTITGSDLYQDISAITITDNSNPAIGATINNGTITVTMGASAVGTYTTNLTFDAVGAEEVTVKVTIEIRALATMNLTLDYLENGYVCDEKIIDNSGRFITFSLESDMYKDGNKITGYSDYVSCVQLYDVTAGSAVTGGISGYLLYDNSITAGGQVTKDVDATTALIIGHKYRFIFTNSEELTDVNGLKYANTYLEFTYVNCSTPTALAACPITNSSFTANWAPVVDCTGDVTVNVYTKSGSVLASKSLKTSVNNWAYASRSADAWGLVGESNSSSNAATAYGWGLYRGGVNYIYSPEMSYISNTIDENVIVTVTATVQNTKASTYYLKVGAATCKNNCSDKNPTFNTISLLYFDGVNTETQTYAVEANTTKDIKFTIKGLTSASMLQFTTTATTISLFLQNVDIAIESNNSVATKTLSCSAGSAEFTGLTANTQYYYTVSDGTNTSNEIAVTTLADGITPTLEFGAGAANLQAESACVSEEIELTGTCMPICDPSDISFAITGTNASMFTYDASNLIITPATGELSGTITITYCPGSAQGNHSALLTATAGTVEATLQLIGTNCPTGFSTMATNASNITATTATANWNQTTTGYVMFSTNGKVNTNLLLNSGFELGTKDGWNELEKLSTAISTTSKKSGTYSLFVPQSQLSFNVTADKKAGPVFANKLTLAPGEYTITANVQGAATDASATAYLAGEFYLGFYNGSKVVYCSDAIESESNKNWQEISASFTLDAEMTVYPFVAHTNSDGAFFLDDVSLICTSATMGENAIEYPITDATSLDLTGLQPSTSYSYYIVNEYGCESNIITFTTESSDAVPTLSAEDVEIIGPVGKTTNGTFFITATNAYAAIVLTNGCNNSPITLATATVPQTGGVVSFSFTPNETHEVIGSGTCTISMITTGMTNPATVNIHWTVAAGEDPNTPIVEVTDITNTSLTIEHNQTTDPNTEVHIVISRETTDEEAGKNLGDEIFFSKYYEAYSHKKLWAIYNPTDRPISLANTYVWRSNGDGDAWSIDIGMDLSQMGNIEPGYIYPNEELIVYTADQVGACEHEKADMSNWVAMSSSDRALSFSGDDALLLVRQDILDSTDDDPTTESQEKEKDENGVDIDDTNKELSWRRYHDEETDTYWWMLDIIGARKNNNTPDNSATKNWTCATTGDKGDAEGWVGAQGDDIAGKYPNTYTLSTNRCLLIRKMTVKSGNNATLENVGDMYTLNTEWRGAHVPYSDDQEETSCENFSFVGGYDYDGYYNAWTSLMDIDATEATRNDDGSYTADGIEVPRFYCHPLRIEVYITETINGEEIDNVKAYIDYKVPIVVDKDITTADQIYFTYPERTDADTEPDFVTSNERSENILDDEICAECDVVIRDGAKLTHIENGREKFRTMQVYPTAKLEIPAGLNMQLEGLHMYAKNDEVGYAIINNDGSSIHAEEIIHIKRIDDMYWYPFSLPYDCKVSSIYQINGKSMGEYWVDWGIKYYDGEARQQEGDNYAGGATSKFWKKLDASETLKAHQGYIIGLFTKEWQGQMKSIYFPPVENTEYTEGGNDAKTTYISNWSDNLTCEPRHRGWNFTGLPYISLFSSQNGDGTTNNNSLMMGSQTDDYATSSIVYVSIPDGGDSRTYTQVSAASVKLEPFKPYFVQAKDPTDGQSHDIALTYSKGGRTLDKIQARSAASTQATIMVELVVANQDATLTDNAGVLVSDRYTEKYEIAADLMKMYAEDRKPQLFTRAANNEMMAYNALPDHLAQNIPLGIYLPNTDEYTISIIDYASQLSDAEAVYLLYNGEIVANLLYADYIVQVQQAGLINGYSLDIRRKQNTTTNINNLTDGAPVITIVDGQIVIQQIPDNAEVQIIDVLGRVLYQQANVPDIITFQAPATGVYNVVITTTEQQFTHKTIIR